MRFKRLTIVMMVFGVLALTLVGCQEVIEQAEYTLTIGATEGGTVVEPGVGEHTIAYGTVVTLVVQAEEGYEFAGWEGPNATEVAADGDNYKITVDSDKEITAVFEEEEPAVIEEPLANLDQYLLKENPYGGATVEGGVQVENVAGPEGDNIDVLFVTAQSGNTLEYVYPDGELRDFSQYSSITFYVKAESDIGLDPIVQNADWNFHKAPGITVTGDGNWHQVTIDPTTYGDAYSNGSDLDLSAIKKVAFEITTTVDFHMTNPVGVVTTE